WPNTFPTCAAINGSVTDGYSAPALPTREADWDNIIDEYTGPTNYNSNDAQKEAVAWLMRYAGQSIPDYYYTSSASGANDPEIYQGCLNMGYTDAEYLLLTELVQSGWSYTNGPQQYTDAEWNEFMLNELHNGRPIEYLAYDVSYGYSVSGHAFNVFGCDANGKYFVNWGWSGDSNGYCTLHNFTTSTGATGQSGSYTFNYGEAMIIGIAPPAGALGPQITVNSTSLAFEGYVGDTYTKTFTVTGANLEGNITISKQGSSYYTVSPTTITAANAANGVQVTVTYKPTTTGNTNAVLTLSSTNAESVTLNITGSAQAKVPTINLDPTSLNFAANLSSTVSKTINVTGLFLTNNISVTLNDNNGVFSVSPTAITASNAANGVPVTVSFNSANEGNFTGSITFASDGAETKTVQLTASAQEGGNATDSYLNIAKYATINQAGASVSGMSSIYKYNEYPSDACAWLTVSNYGLSQVDANQNWYDCEGTAKPAEGTWNASDIFLGSASYHTGTAYFANWNEAYTNYYVTNCSQVKQYAYNIQSSYNTGNVYPLKMYIYECTLNADGTINAGTSTVDYKESTTTNQDEITSSIDLDPSKIYKVRIYNDYSRLYEIGFKTPIEGIETPVATEATEIGANEFTANWNACEDATSYTLRVMPKPEAPATTLLITEGFGNCTSDGTADVGSSLNNYMDNAGWTGSTVYTATGGL
ncbi:MAG: C10 family peptidase, partial [Muribaculaceae bacterium]|nr:C10 family peptidase [Muribaculaceae bacterium]